MFTAFSEIDDKMKLKVLIAWKGRVVMESNSSKYRGEEKLNGIYGDFCDVIHANTDEISVLKLRLSLIKVLNTDEPILTQIKNFKNHIFSKTFGISDMDMDKIITSWNLRTKLEKNKNYIYTDESKDIYEHLSNILHGQVEKHNMAYIKTCEKKVDKFFKDIKELHTYKIKPKAGTINLKNLTHFKKRKFLTTKKAKVSTIFFFKSTFSNRRIAFIENDQKEIDKIMRDNYVILKEKSRDIGTFEFIDSVNYYTFIKANNIKMNHHYQFHN